MEDELRYRQNEEATFFFFFCIFERSKKMYDHHSLIRIFFLEKRIEGG